LQKPAAPTIGPWYHARDDHQGLCPSRSVCAVCRATKRRAAVQSRSSRLCKCVAPGQPGSSATITMSMKRTFPGCWWRPVEPLRNAKPRPSQPRQ
jgi:hypothetical protein